MADGTCSVVENGKPCGGRPHGRGWCRKHYERWLRHGDPLVTAKRGKGVLLAELRAAGKTTSDECEVLTMRGDHRPTAMLDGTQMLASRAVWILAKGDPGELHVLHTCHRGDDGCINIRHLYLGTNTKNIRDMVDGGRSTRGERNPAHRLTQDEVREIRRRHVPGSGGRGGNSEALAAEYGVKGVTIRNIVARRRWAWLDAEPA